MDEWLVSDQTEGDPGEFQIGSSGNGDLDIHTGGDRERTSLSSDSFPKRDPVGWFLDQLGGREVPTREEELDLAWRVQEGKRAEERLAALLGVPKEAVAEAVRGWLKREAYGPSVSPLSSPEERVGGMREKILSNPEAQRNWHLAVMGALASHELVERNLRLAASVAMEEYYKRHPSGLTLSDCIAEGARGLMKAVEKYDPGMGTKFSTYATWWIRQAVVRAIEYQGGVVRLPSYLQKELAHLGRGEFELEAELKRPPTPAELAAKLGEGWTEERVRELAPLRQPAASLDAPEEEGGGVLGDRLASPVSSPEDEAIWRALRERIHEAMEKLPPRERYILERRFGFADGSESTLEEIGKELSLSRERVRQLEARALAQLARDLDAWGYDPEPASLDF